jgi:predicted PurR-regulated permease PerM
MMGGIFIFGIMGVIIGPLILAYFLVFLQSYKDRTLYSLFSDKSVGSESP